MAGICLIRLINVRPRFLPFPLGIGSENAAHRFAVAWGDGSTSREGVFIPRRDTNSRVNVWAGGRIFSGIHHYASFHVDEDVDHLCVSFESQDGSVRCHLSGKVAEGLPKNSVFSNVDEASKFFQRGSLGYSVTESTGHYDGLELRCKSWNVQPFEVEAIHASYFEDESVFPRGSVEFDCALLMRGIEHEWHAQQELCCNA